MGLKLAVAGAFVVDSVCTMAACATIYIVRDSGPGNCGSRILTVSIVLCYGLGH
jgi:hypothetical protein